MPGRSEGQDSDSTPGSQLRGPPPSVLPQSPRHLTSQTSGQSSLTVTPFSFSRTLDKITLAQHAVCFRKAAIAT